MKTVYLIRHGEVAFPGGVKRCISGTDLPLSPAGRAQGLALRKYFEDIPLSGVYHSGLLRAKETAALLSPRAEETAGLEELGVGLWEGRTFQEIRTVFPELYQKRGENPERYQIPGGEPLQKCLDRVSRALRTLLERTAGDFAVVAHAGANRLLLCSMLELPLRNFLTIPQPYGCVNLIRAEADNFSVREVGLLPSPAEAIGGSYDAGID